MCDARALGDLRAEHADDRGVDHLAALGGRTIRGDQGHLVLGERIAPQSEVIRAILSGDSPRWWGPRTFAVAATFASARLANSTAPSRAPRVAPPPSSTPTRPSQFWNAASSDCSVTGAETTEHVSAYSRSRDCPQGLQL